MARGGFAALSPGLARFPPSLLPICVAFFCAYRKREESGLDKACCSSWEAILKTFRLALCYKKKNKNQPCCLIPVLQSPARPVQHEQGGASWGNGDGSCRGPSTNPPVHTHGMPGQDAPFASPCAGPSPKPASCAPWAIFGARGPEGGNDFNGSPVGTGTEQPSTTHACARGRCCGTPAPVGAWLCLGASHCPPC